jgi:hypothetical protein
MEKEILYQDNLIEISNDSLTLKNYYFPSKSPKKIFFTEIKEIETKQPSFFSGKWRVHGTGDFRTWYPQDSKRHKRNKIFVITYKNKWMRSGFTVENSETVEKILIKKGLIK